MGPTSCDFYSTDQSKVTSFNLHNDLKFSTIISFPIILHNPNQHGWFSTNRKEYYLPLFVPQWGHFKKQCQCRFGTTLVSIAVSTDVLFLVL